MTRDEMYDIADNYVNAKPVSWDDLPETNSLWDYLPEGDGDDIVTITEKEIIELADEAYNDRFTDAADEMGFSGEDIEGMLDI